MLQQLPRSAGQPSLWLRALRIAAGATRFITLSDETVAARNAAAKASSAAGAASAAATLGPAAAGGAEHHPHHPPSPATPDAEAKAQSGGVGVKQRKPEATKQRAALQRSAAKQRAAGASVTPPTRAGAAVEALG